MRATAAFLLAALAAAPSGRAFEWPVARPEEAAADPLAPFRWDRVSHWHAPAFVELRNALARLDASRDDSARAYAARAVLLRLLHQEDDARAALRRALSLAPDGRPLDDPDVALTAAWLAARSGDLAAATGLGLRALARMPPAPAQVSVHREALALEVARWSMARGPEGLADAARVLRGLTLQQPASPMVRATLALALAREGRLDDARLLAAPLRDSLQPSDGADDRLPRGAVILGEGAAAVGVALALAGRARDAAGPLALAAREAPAPWRAFQAAQLARGRGAP